MSVHIIIIIITQEVIVRIIRIIRKRHGIPVALVVINAIVLASHRIYPYVKGVSRNGRFSSAQFDRILWKSNNILIDQRRQA